MARTEEPGGARARVLDASRMLWPAPARATLARTAPQVVTGRCQTYVMLPGPSRPWWLLPADRRSAAQALGRHDVGQRNEAIWRYLALAQRTGLLALVPLVTRLHVEVPAGSPSIETELAAVFGEPVDVCVRLGRTRDNRAVVIRPIDASGTTPGFAKLATSDAGAETLRREAANLERVVGRLPSGLVAPRLLHRGHWNGHALLVMEALLPGHDNDNDSSIPADVMLRLARSAGVRDAVLAASPFVAAQRERAESLGTDRSRSLLLEAVGTLTDAWGDVTIPLGAWHGDWVPWNMARTDGVLQLWDWENFADGVPLGWDLIHYLAQDLRNSVGNDKATEDRWLAEATALLRIHVGMSDDAIDATIFGYLVEANLRFVVDRDATGGPPVARAGWGLTLLARLAARGRR